MEKKSLIIIIAVILIFVIAIAGVLIATNVFEDKYVLSEKDIESIVITKQGRGEYHTLNIEDTENFIKLYNKSSYEGEGTGEGGTPEYGVLVNLKDNKKLYINQFGFSGKDFEVSLKASTSGEQIMWYYVSSNELENFVKELIARNFV